MQPPGQAHFTEQEAGWPWGLSSPYWWYPLGLHGGLTSPTYPTLLVVAPAPSSPSLTLALLALYLPPSFWPQMNTGAFIV